MEQEFREFLTCGVLAHGFARLRYGACAFERLVPFSCKGRGFCPSCGGRRMTERAAHLVDEVLPHVPVRQWVLSLPYRLRYFLAWDHDEKLAALTPRPRINLVLYHGVLAAHARWRSRVVAYGTPPLTVPSPVNPLDSSGDDRPAPPAKRRYWPWASLMRRAFDVDVLACPRCGGRLQLIATIDDPQVIREILASLARPTAGADRAPPHFPPVPTGDPVTTVPA